MEHYYLDNGSTSFPKAPGVGDAMKRFIDEVGVNVGRGSYPAAYAAMETVLDTRERLCALFGFSRAENVIFTSGVTLSLNLLLRGFLQPGDHVLTTSMEHNAVMRPLTQLSQEGVAFDRIPCRRDGTLCTQLLESSIRPNTRAVVMTHASNVCGTVLPVAEVGEICHRRGLRLIVDCAQTAGVFPVDMTGWHIDALAFTGHKGLLGPQGIGGFLIGEEMAAQVRPVLSGGTGSQSHLEETPAFLPDRYEPGTQNLPGIFGLNAALRYLRETGIDAIRRRELALTGRLLDGLRQVDGVRIVGKDDLENRTAVVSIDFLRRDNAEAAYDLEQAGILTRCGLHCAPAAHRTLGTYPQGTVRFAPGHTTTETAIDAAIAAVGRAAKA